MYPGGPIQETEASRHEGRWRSIIRSAVDGIILIDARGRNETFNHAAERLFGYTEAEVLGRNLTSTVVRRGINMVTFPIVA